ncbi:hypothetical protein BI036_gp222 [Morganella phage vB_MmoM_MP1]|uniref:Uncharacterized protein n=1 Tax=Morganella phage vB_MmoM_MP1 TaxID=1852628 RepID=A0A192YBS6_9CAUD|nr:hypothetical protein BI036_gp222 [Morganella phage vB_MmoM_MP1]ANM46580.1 hypothetical protein MP1_gp0172 [Morganella phage vB_MmoM_MP1]
MLVDEVKKVFNTIDLDYPMIIEINERKKQLKANLISASKQGDKNCSVYIPLTTMNPDSVQDTYIFNFLVDYLRSEGFIVQADSRNRIMNISGW